MKRCLLFLALGVATAAHSQTIVYDNTTTSLHNDMPLLPAWLDNSDEAGDDIWLAGTEREVVQLRLIFNYRGTAPGTMDLRIRFRGLVNEELPGDPFYESGLIAGVPTVAGLNTYNFDIPHVVVPGHFVWTVQAYNRQGSVGELGPAYYNPATVGFSDDFFWLSHTGTDWTAYNWGGDPYANFAARVTAVVPEPGGTAALGLALASWVRMRIRRRRSR